MIRALARSGFADIAEKISAVQKLRISGDYLQDFSHRAARRPVLSAVNDPNDYAGRAPDTSSMRIANGKSTRFRRRATRG